MGKVYEKALEYFTLGKKILEEYCARLEAERDGLNSVLYSIFVSARDGDKSGEVIISKRVLDDAKEAYYKKEKEINK